MAYIVVENFSAGLDTRRHPLTAKSGTLQKLVNAHLSRGGEIEKRKAFEVINNYESVVFTRPFHGLQATADKLYTFTDGWNSQTSERELPVGGNGLYAKFLKHPSYDLGYNSGQPPQLTDIVYSTLYGGNTFVIAKWDNGDVIPYLDGEFIADFYVGTTRSWMQTWSNPWDSFCATIMWQINGGTFGSSTTGWSATSSNVAYPAAGYVDVTAPVGVNFTPSYSTDALVPVTTSVLQEYVAPKAEVLASGSFAVTGGYAQPARLWTDGRNLDAASLPGIRSIRAGASSPSAADGLDLIGWGGTIGLKYNTYPNNEYTAGSNHGLLLYNIAKVINENTNAGLNHKYSAYSYLRDYNGGNDTNSMYLYAPAEKGANANGTIVQIEFDSDPSGVYDVYQLIIPSTIAPSPYNPGKFIATMGTLGVGTGDGGGSNAGATNAITSVTVDGIEILGATKNWSVSHSNLMQAVVDQINTYSSTPEYTATLSGGRVIITALAGTGKTPNGRPIEVKTSGNVIIGSVIGLGGGVAHEDGKQKVVRYTIGGGTFYPDKNVTLIATKELDSANPIYWGATRVTNSKPVAALTYKTKAHLGASSSLFFSGVNQPTKWGQDGVGAGFINMSNNSGGNEVLSAIALYQGNVASFSRRTVQLWSVDTDPANNRQGQVLSNTGAFGQKSVVSVGDIDVFYLSDSGVRSIRARDSSNSAVVNDVGTPIDNLVLADISVLTDDQKSKCPAVIEPIDGRYWLAIGNKIYVYSYFPSSQVAAWSTYSPGHSFTEFTTKDGKVYAKEGNYVYVYGGINGGLYDSSPVEVVMPYLDGGKPAHMKTLNGIDMTCEGEWAVEIGMDPISPNARDHVATVSQPTFTLGRIQASGMGTHVGVRLTCDSSGYARLANLIAHIDFNESD
jgi:hypothetical protein